MDWAELIMRRKNVAEFIRTDPVAVEFTRLSQPTRTTGGGVKPGKSETLPPQTVRIVQNVRRYTAGIVNAEAGDVPNGLYVLIGKHTLDLQADDIFEAAGEKYIVLGKSALRGNEYTLATLDFYGPKNVVAPSPTPITETYPPHVPIVGMATVGNLVLSS